MGTKSKKAKKSKKAAKNAGTAPNEVSLPDVDLRAALRLPPGDVSLADHDPRELRGVPGGKRGLDKETAAAAMPVLGARLAELQERLYAEGKQGSDRRVLLILQGMDTSGKGGVLRHSVALVDPQGVRITAFKAPTAEERRHDFLWRIKRALPDPGIIGVFDRSHYEDVLIARVRELTTRATITRRYAAINRFEQELTDRGVTVVKCMLHISPEEQKERLRARLDDPSKHWKYNPGDLDERALWPAYTEAYEVALEKTNTEAAPWFVIPSDRKWYRNWAVATLLLEHLEALDPQWPAADFDVDAEVARLDAEDPLSPTEPA